MGAFNPVGYALEVGSQACAEFTAIRPGERRMAQRYAAAPQMFRRSGSA